MPYTDAADVRNALNRTGAADNEKTAASLSDAQLNDTIVEAQVEIDARLRDRYDVPFADDEVPGLVKVLTRDLAAYDATLRHREAQTLAEDHPVRLRYGRALDLLVKLASGEIDLSDAEEAVAVSPTALNPYEGELFPIEQFGIGPGAPYGPHLG